MVAWPIAGGGIPEEEETATSGHVTGPGYLGYFRRPPASWFLGGTAAWLLWPVAQVSL